MTWPEMMEILDWMTPRWPEVGRWSDERIYAWFEDLERWPTDAVRIGVRDIYENGAKVPNGGAVIRIMRALGYAPDAEALEGVLPDDIAEHRLEAVEVAVDPDHQPVAVDDDQHRHVWAILEWEDERDDGARLAECIWRPNGTAARCGESRTFSPEELRTPGEIEELAGTRR